MTSLEENLVSWGHCVNVSFFYLWRVNIVGDPGPDLTVWVQVAHVPTVLPANHIPDSLNVLGIEVKPIGGTGVTAKGHIIGGQAASADDDGAKEKKDPQGQTWTKTMFFLCGSFKVLYSTMFNLPPSPPRFPLCQRMLGLSPGMFQL
jgi:hypothetical protein